MSVRSESVEDILARLRPRLQGHGLVLYDGACGFCQFSVQFILDRDPKGRFLFAPLQSSWVPALIGRPIAEAELETLLLVLEGRVYERSSAVLMIARDLRFPWRLLALFRFMPRWPRDLIYRGVARIRNELPLRRLCRVLTPAERTRFLEN